MYYHYSQLIYENKSWLYYAHSKGYIYKILKSDKSKVVKLGYMKDGVMSVKLNGKAMNVKTIIASKFMRDYKPGMCIGCKDKDEANLNVENLYLYTMRMHGKLTGYKSRSKKILVTESGITKEYRSVRSCAKALGASYQTLLDYLSGKYVNSVLAKEGRVIRYA